MYSLAHNMKGQQMKATWKRGEPAPFTVELLGYSGCFRTARTLYLGKPVPGCIFGSVEAAQRHADKCNAAAKVN